MSSSRINNKALGVTGILLYADGNIIQVLEGDEEKVRKTYSKIEQDPRHRRTNILLQEPITERAFPEWTMGFKFISNELMIKSGINQFFVKGSDKPEIRRRSVETLLNSFSNITAA